TWATSGMDLVGKTVLDGRLKIVRLVGKGAFGAVYHVIDDQSRDYALKALAPSPRHIRSDLYMRQFDAQFELECVAHCAVNGHPNVASILECFEENDIRFILMEYCSGYSLNQHIANTARFWRNDKEIKRVFTQILDAVAHCHSRGVSHRDLKPENILSDAEGETFQLIDFGLACLQKMECANGVGTGPFMAPDSVPNAYDDKYDTRAGDVWALGIILINMICAGFPWLQAVQVDDGYHCYLTDPDFLSNNLAIAPSLVPLLKAIFHPCAEARISLPDLQRVIKDTDRFHMN
ncbi:kinase-like domain-containing protein, partial [Vararia minispora EC-137]